MRVQYIPTTGTDEGDFDAIEEAAAEYIRNGWSPEDAEPGEWLILVSPSGDQVTIEIQNENEED